MKATLEERSSFGAGPSAMLMDVGAVGEEGEKESLIEAIERDRGVGGGSSCEKLWGRRRISLTKE